MEADLSTLAMVTANESRGVVYFFFLETGT